MKKSDTKSDLKHESHEKGTLKLAFSMQIDFASRFPPRQLEASRLRGFEASRLRNFEAPIDLGKKSDEHFVRFRRNIENPMAIDEEMRHLGAKALKASRKKENCKNNTHIYGGF